MLTCAISSSLTFYMLRRASLRSILASLPELLIEAEECHAGNRDLKPGPRGKPLRKPRRHEERSEDLKPDKSSAPRPPVGSEYRDVNVMLKYDTQTKGGTKFERNEILRVSSYYRKKLNLYDPKKKDRSIHGISIRDVSIMGKIK